MVIAGAPNAAAQSDTSADRNNVSVRDRARALYGAEGIRAGAFLAYPTVGLYENYTSNVFASESDEVSDVATRLNLGFGLESNWSTNRLGISLEGARNWYADQPKQDTTDSRAAISGRYDLSRQSYLSGDVSYGTAHEAIAESPTAAELARPIELTRGGAGVGFSQAFANMRVSATAQYDKYDYQDGILLDNSSLEQDARDVEVQRGTLRVDYSLSPSMALFASASHNRHIHDTKPSDPVLNRDSDGEQFLTGVRFDLTELLVGEVAIGQYSQHYEAPGVSDNSSGTFQTQLEWYPDELVTVTLEANASAGDSGIAGSAGFISTRVAARADYEFRRNVLFSAGVEKIEDDYAGVDRIDTRWTHDVSMDYIISRRWSAYVSVSHHTQDSTGQTNFVGREFDLDQVSFGVKLTR